eukprot:3340988-Pleurochrysis_carterae.AAC.1
MEAIRETAFVTTDLPLVLSLDVKASAKGQQRAADIIRQVLRRGQLLVMPHGPNGAEIGLTPLDRLRGQ